MRPGVRSLAALAALALAACSNARAPTPEAAVPGLAVKLEAPGAAPRRVVRFAFVKGARATLDLRLDLQLGVEVNRQRMDIPPLPGLAVRVTVTIAVVIADGSAGWSAVFARATAIASPGVAPETVAALTAALPTDKTFTATGVVTPAARCARPRWPRRRGGARGGAVPRRRASAAPDGVPAAGRATGVGAR
jgi:hypothetical protein